MPRNLLRITATLATTIITVAALGTAAHATAATPLVALGGAEVDTKVAADLTTLPSAAPYGAFVHFSPEATAAEREAALSDQGLVVTARFDVVDAVFAVGTVGDMRGLTSQPAVTYVEANRRLRHLGDTGPWASRVRVAQHAVASGPYRDGRGAALDGRGVGVAIIDSGIDGTHPDLAGRMGRNFKIVCSTGPFINTTTEQCFGPIVMQEVDSSDTTGGHGTHVAGIAAGDGTASRGTYEGVAPGATLHGFGTGETILVLTAATSFAYILDHYDEFTPRIRVINNSWGDDGGTRHKPDSVTSKLVAALVAKGVSVVFAAGNDFGDGSTDRTSSFAKDPTPGVISAANYDDRNTGNRNAALAPSSSRGALNDPLTYPDLSAPGTSIVAACTQTLPTCTAGARIAWAPHYSALTGTSMAAPHIAGAAAVLYQARPDLTPAQVEDLLADTALKFRGGGSYFADPQNAGGTTSFDKGAGLLDVPAALDALGVAHDGPQTRATAPTVTVTTPAPGQTNDGSVLAVSGTAHDGRPQPALLSEQTVIADDGGDVAGPGAADIVGLSVLELENGFRYRVAFRSVTDIGAEEVLVGLNQNVDGLARTTAVVLSATGARAETSTSSTFAAALQPVVDPLSNTLTFTVPFDALGNPPPGSPAHNVWIATSVGAPVDVAPGGTGADAFARPRYGAPYSLFRPSAVPTAAARVTVALNGGVEQPAVLTGSTPSYGWEAALDTTTLPDGDHSLLARFYLDGVVAATSTVAFRVARPPVLSEIAIATPQDAQTIERTVVTIAGTASTSAPLTTKRLVTVQVTGTEFDSGEAVATGVESWSSSLDFSPLRAGTYRITSRLYVGDKAAAVNSITVELPPVPAPEVSCAPKTLTWWRNQYAGKGIPAFTATEADMLLARAAEVSAGWFADAAAVRDALLADGKLSVLTQASRQYAALALNLAGGDLSATMSSAVGLSGAEALLSKTYDVGVLGTTVQSASEWVRAQLPDGNVGGANEVATALNKGTGLDC